MRTRQEWLDASSDIDTMPLWRYLDLAKFVALLSKRTMWFARADRCGDDFEGSLSSATKERFTASLPRLIERFPGQPDTTKLPDLWKHCRTWANLSCWHMNEHESAAMWAVYGLGSGAVAVRTNVRTLVECLPDDPRLYVGALRYADYSGADVSIEHLAAPFFSKRSSYAHEREFRAVAMRYTSPGKTTMEFDSALLAPGVGFPVDLDRLIHGVHVSPKADPWIRDTIASLCDVYGLKVLPQQSAMDAAPLF